VEETKGATEQDKDNDALWEDGYEELSDNDLRLPGPSDRQ
jgi:hypothetical protein